MSKEKLNEGMVSRFIDGFFDSYKKGLQRQFIKKSAQRNPELGKALVNVNKELDDLEKKIQKLLKK